MQVIDLKKEYVAEAEKLICSCYEEEREIVGDLPACKKQFDLSSFVDNSYSVIAVDDNKVVGVLCSYAPFENAFGSTDVKGVFSPMGANASIKKNREKIYAAMYQAIAKRWVKAGALSHAICIFAHDEGLQREFYRLGFGLRCVDAIRKMAEIDVPSMDGFSFMEMPIEEYYKIYSLYEQLNQHYQKSPFFMNREKLTKDKYYVSIKEKNSRFFVAYHQHEICAYFEVAKSGETCICNDQHYLHICGAFCLSKYRGKGVAQNLLNYAIKTLKAEGYTMLGVDFESLNPTAYGFWTKYFTPYTHSVVRRIDEDILNTEQRNEV